MREKRINKLQKKVKIENFLLLSELVWSWSCYEIPFRSSLMQRGIWKMIQQNRISISYQWQGQQDFFKLLFNHVNFSEINIHSHSLFITWSSWNTSNHQIRCESFNYTFSLILRPENFYILFLFFSHFISLLRSTIYRRTIRISFTTSNPKATYNHSFLSSNVQTKSSRNKNVIKIFMFVKQLKTHPIPCTLPIFFPFLYFPSSTTAELFTLKKHFLLSDH